jgi:hypothetical protein
MTRRRGFRAPLLIALVASLGALQGCTENTARGNDREAGLSPPEPPAEVASVSDAIDGVVGLHPQVMSDADLGNVPAVANGCHFKMTRVDHPVAAYGSTAVLKLNGKLVTLSGSGEEPSGLRRYSADGVTVTLRPLDDPRSDGDAFPAELVLWLPDASHELGYHGFSVCGG